MIFFLYISGIYGHPFKPRALIETQFSSSSHKTVVFSIIEWSLDDNQQTYENDRLKNRSQRVISNLESDKWQI